MLGFQPDLKHNCIMITHLGQMIHLKDSAARFRRQVTFSDRIWLPVVLEKEPAHAKTNKMACAPNEDSNQPGHTPSLIRVFAVRSLGS